MLPLRYDRLQIGKVAVPWFVTVRISSYSPLRFYRHWTVSRASRDRHTPGRTQHLKLHLDRWAILGRSAPSRSIGSKEDYSQPRVKLQICDSRMWAVRHRPWQLPLLRGPRIGGFALSFQPLKPFSRFTKVAIFSSPRRHRDCGIRTDVHRSDHASTPPAPSATVCVGSPAARRTDAIRATCLHIRSVTSGAFRFASKSRESTSFCVASVRRTQRIQVMTECTLKICGCIFSDDRHAGPAHSASPQNMERL